MAVSRRDLFKFISAGTLLVPVSYVVSVSLGVYPEREGLKFLTDKEARILESVTEVVVPTENGIGVSPAEINIVNRLDDFIMIMPPHSQSRIRFFLWTVEHLFPLRSFYFKKFSHLTIEHRQKILERFDRSRGVAGRAMVRALKALIQTCYYSDPRVAEKIEFVGRCEK